MSDKYVYAVEQISDRSWALVDKDVRIFLFAGTERALLVDSGHGSGDLLGAVSDLTDLPVILINTHADHDHIGGNAQFGTAFMHPSEFARYRLELDEFNITVGKGHVVSPLWEGDVVDIGGRRFEVLHVPGHTPGCLALLDAENRILLGGDSILDDKIAMIGPWRNFDAYICSIEKLIGQRSRFDFVYTPHGGFPVGSDILDGILAGARRCQKGEVEGIETDFIKGAKIYDVGVAKFVY